MKHMKILRIAAVATVALALSLTGCSTSTSSIKGVDRYVDGYKAYQSGDVEKAINELEKAVKSNPDLRMARIVLGEIYRSRNDYNAASKQYEVLINNDGYTLSNHYYLGVSYQMLTRYDESATAYLRGLKLDPKDSKSCMNLGMVYLSLGDADNAMNYLDKATVSDPKSAMAWSNYGVVLDARGSYAMAETAYRKAIELDTNSITVQQNLASNLMAQQKFAEAVALWEQIIKKSDTNYAHTRLAEAYGLAGKYDDASAQFDLAEKIDPNSLITLNTRAATLIKQYEEQGRVKDDLRNQAVTLWIKSLSLNPNQPKMAELLAKWKNDTVFKKP